MGEEATIDGLLKYLAVLERLDAIMDKALKRLLMLKVKFEDLITRVNFDFGEDSGSGVIASRMPANDENCLADLRRKEAELLIGSDENGAKKLHGDRAQFPRIEAY